jgi:type IV secretory pathway VirD2 relaxase
MTRAEFLKEIGKQPERGVIAHKLVFSLSQSERDEFGTDMRQLVRAAMDDWSQRLGRSLKWIGFEHMDAGHPHVHVVVAGYAGEKQVGLFERDLTSLRVSTEREKSRQAELERVLPSRRQEISLEQELRRIAREIESLRPREVEREPTRRPERSRGSNWDRGR